MKIHIDSNPEQLGAVEVSITLTMTIAQLELVAKTLRDGNWQMMSLARLITSAADKYRVGVRSEAAFEEP